MDTAAQPTKSKSIRKALKKFFLYALIGGGSIVLLISIREVYFYINPLARINFKMFMPTKLPSNISFQNKELEILRDEIWPPNLFWPFPRSVFFEVHFTNKLLMTQEKDKPSSKSDHDPCRDTFAHISCKTLTTAGGQQYDLRIETYDTSDYAQEYVYFTKDKTSFLFRRETTSSHLTPVTAWSDIIDSLVPTNTSGLKVGYYPTGE